MNAILDFLKKHNLRCSIWVNPCVYSRSFIKNKHHCSKIKIANEPYITKDKESETYMEIVQFIYKQAALFNYKNENKQLLKIKNTYDYRTRCNNRFSFEK